MKRRCIPSRREPFQYVAAELDDAGEDLAWLLEDNDLLAIQQSDRRIWRLLDELDEIGVHDQGLVVESREVNHRWFFSTAGNEMRNLDHLSHIGGDRGGVRAEVEPLVTDGYGREVAKWNSG